MNTYSLLTRPIPQNTYETIEKPYKSDFMPFKTDENISRIIFEKHLENLQSQIKE